MSRVLVVDDLESNRDLLRVLLDGSGFEVVEARNGREALERAAEAAPDVVVSDLLMPEMDGFSLLRRWKADERLRRIPFLVYTATYTDPADERLVRELGADAFLLKPAEPDDFLAEVRDLLERAAREDWTSKSTPGADEATQLLAHGWVLERKLQEKLRQLEFLNSQLKRDVELRTRTERELADTLDRLRMTAAAGNVGLWDWDLVTNRVFYSPEWKRQIGYEDHEIPDHFSEWESRVHPDDLDRSLRTVRAFIADPWPDYRLEFRFRHRDGSYRWILVQASLLLSPDGKPVRMLGSHVDITDRKVAEERLAASEDRYRCLAEASPSGVAILVAGSCSYANPTLCRLLGVSGPDALLGEQGLDWIDPCDRIRVEKAWADAIGEGPRIDPQDVRIVRRDGSVFDAEMLHSPLSSLGGGALQLVVNDVSRRKAAEAEREQLLRAMSQTEEAIIITSADGTIRFVNEAVTRVFGFAASEAIGERPFVLRGDLLDESVLAGIRSALAAGSPWHGDLTLCSKDGTRVPTSTSVVRVLSPDGPTVAYVGVLRDVTKLGELTHQLSEARRLEALGRLAGGVAHDHNNMLAAILMHVDLALDQIPEGHPASEHLAAIRASAERSASITRQLLTFARRQPVSPQAVDLNEAVESVLGLLRPMLGEAIDLKWSPGRNLGAVLVDPAQVDQVVTNLCMNSRDAIDHAGTITVSTRRANQVPAPPSGPRPGSWVVLSVEDDGHGMTPEVAEHVFEPFYTTKPVGEGTGLGMATVYGAVTQSKGSVHVESRPGLGTTVRVWFPTARSAEHPADVPSDRQAPVGGSETILLVEDEAPVREAMVLALTRLGYRVLLADRPSEALRVAAGHEGGLDLVLTDLVMPEMTGVDLVRALRERRPGAAAIVMSGYASAGGLPEESGDEGARFLRKPFSLAELSRAIRAALD